MYNFKIILIAGIAMLWLHSCGPKEATLSNQDRQFIEELRKASEENGERSESITLNYANESSGIEINLDPEKDEFYLDLKGMQPAEKDTVVIADSTLIKQRDDDIREVLTKFRRAQDLFYLDEYTEALRLLNETLEIAETADAYALKGTIHFMMGNRNATRQNWNRAVQLNPDLPIPSIPELEELIEDIINEELPDQDNADTTEGEQEQAEGD